MTVAYIGSQRHQLSPSQVIGEGGEADIYDVGNGQVLKLYKQPNDPAYAGNPVAVQGAKERLAEYQQKLPAMKSLHLPNQVVSPIELAYKSSTKNQLVGFTMKYLKDMEVLLKLGDRVYREQGGIEPNKVLSVFTNLHGLVMRLHTLGVVIGDFNDLNVLMDTKDQVFLVDSDSLQFTTFLCRTFTSRFVDPLNCDTSHLVLNHPHSKDSDWYAYNNMLFQSLLYVGPYGGVHKPKSGKKLQHDARVLARKTVFAPDIIYPKPALPFDRLPDDFLQHFSKVYTKDFRTQFPLGLIQAMRWTRCSKCGIIHARPVCPNCLNPGIVMQTIKRRGTVSATSVYHTSGQILQAVHQRGKLRYLIHENGVFYRENKREVMKGVLDPELRYRLSGDTTFIGKRHRLLTLTRDEGVTQQETETVNNLSIFDANSSSHFWLDSGQLLRSDTVGARAIGNILSNRTLFWTGERFGIGFYRAGELTRTFCFSTSSNSLNDDVKVPVVKGQLIDATCVFSAKLGWLMMSVQDNGRLVNHCFVISDSGEVVASHSTNQEEDSWLAGRIRGNFASGSSMFVALDSGIVRIDAESGRLHVSQTFPDTEPFVSATSQLLAGDGGIYVINSKEIVLLKIKETS
jgi:serine/threonine protein kinase